MVTKGIVKYQDSISGSEVELSITEIKNNICPKATDKEASNFLRLCQYMGLNPFVNDAYLIKYGDSPASMVVGKDAFTKRADAHPQFAGMESGVVVMMKNGIEPIHRKGTLVLADEDIVGGWARVARADRKLDVETTVSFSEFSTGRAMWAKMPATMIEKVAIVKSLRTAFPATFSGLYDQAEMGIDMSQDLEPVNSGNPNLMEEIEADRIANPKPEPQVKPLSEAIVTAENERRAKIEADEVIQPDAPSLVEVAETMGAVAVEEEPSESEEQAIINATETPSSEGNAPHCAEHGVDYEYRFNPDTNVGKYVHAYFIEEKGEKRRQWCVAQDEA
jgi:phage recombination protein Bet